MSSFQRSLLALQGRDPRAHQRVLEELVYLANVLVAGDSAAGRALRPVEAAARALELCDEGLRTLLDPTARRAAPDAVETLSLWGAVGLFRVAWSARSPKT